MSNTRFLEQYPNSELIETMRLNRAGEVLLLALHLRRLQRSAQQLGFKYELPLILNALKPYLHISHNQPQRLRLSITGTGQPIVSCTPLDITPQPVHIKLNHTPLVLPASSRRLHHKTSQRHHWGNGEQWLQQHPYFFDVLYADAAGFITEGGRTNVYIWQQDHWITPPLEFGLLGGVMREWLISKGWVKEAPISQKALLQAPAVRVSNALRGWLDAKVYINT